MTQDLPPLDAAPEVVTRRDELQRPIVLTTNKAYSHWPTVFPNAACTVTMVDRLIHRSWVIEIARESYRLREAKERAAKTASCRKKNRIDQSWIPKETNEDMTFRSSPTFLRFFAASNRNVPR